MTLNDFNEADLVNCIGNVWRIDAFHPQGVYLSHAEYGQCMTLIASYNAPASLYIGYLNERAKPV